MAGKIFINYRRDDSIGTAGRLHDRLAQAFGRKNLFMDVDHIPAGVDFVSYLNAQVAVCDVFLAVIGPRWLDAKDEAGNRRIDNPEDFVSVEIAAALTRDIRVIPVLVDGAHMPKAADLPVSLRPLARRNAVEVRNAQFGRDAEALTKKVREAFRHDQKLNRWRVAAAGAFALLLAGGIGFYQMKIRELDVGPVELEVIKLQEAARDAEAEARRKAREEMERKVKEEAARGAQEEAARKAQEEAARKATEEADRKAREEANRKSEEVRREPALAVTPGSGQSFRDRLADGQPCPMCSEMLVVPRGSFTMGSPQSEPGHRGREGPQIAVTIARRFAVGRFAVTFDEWDACVADSSCNDYRPSDQGWGRGKRPVINVSWDDAQVYVGWLSRKTGKTYRLLSEAEREYVTRAGTTTPFWWGSSITPSQANYDGQAVYEGGGGKGENRARTVSVDSFAPNPWGLYNVHGNVREWTVDCWNDSHQGNPGDGSARTTGNCNRHVIRGGSWESEPEELRAANRFWAPILRGWERTNSIGFRVGRMLTP